MISCQDRDELSGTEEATSPGLKREKLQVTRLFQCEKSPKDFELCVFATDQVNA